MTLRPVRAEGCEKRLFEREAGERFVSARDFEPARRFFHANGPAIVDFEPLDQKRNLQRITTNETLDPRLGSRHFEVAREGRVVDVAEGVEITPTHLNRTGKGISIHRR